MNGRPIVAVIGAGAWGTALACALAAVADVKLWSHTPLPAGTRHTPRLPDITLPPNVELVGDLPAVADCVLMVVPTQALREVSAKLARVLAPAVPVVSCCKGLEHGTALMPLEVLTRTMPGHPLAVLGGPNFAIEVARGLPAAATLAAGQRIFAQELAENLSTPAFRLYASTDPLGVQLAGAAKNVYAIGAGVCIGAGMGENARAALLTRALAELGRLVEALGGQSKTVYGMAGMGDLVLTCTGIGSRNYSLGMALGSGESLDSILAARTTVAEGVLTAPTLAELGPRYDVETPIIDAIARLLRGQVTAQDVRKELFGRPQRLE
ncbi:NAD(P)-dependent glycerol-3-phosphate dehydrogenase [Oecophyllibacter saccharovorans]|uniref:NAD(P)H-dependent glycerol-3-phosphate dehydrogenase n=1 Tax=Oecophyllibacter saccharovorans TaxID=2558360 RepID=UPI001144F7F0|nr:NAD(P)H-dependent glycerol-3-phosphate dehydrogenase [Oecophyllibacter saccharovorans]QDH15704.1 NAD(P)-dependent glycerol-3-phosphate dehydrogenase [Oecophyllibacter saccharovorans]